MGCIPSILAQNPIGSCSDEVNQLVTPFNANVKTMLSNLNANLPGARFTFIDIARMFQDILTNYRAYGMQFMQTRCKSTFEMLGNLPCSQSINSNFYYFCFLICFVGFSVINRGCCGIGRNRGQVTCLPLQTPCPNREQYVFWDAFHPTEAVNILMGRKAFNGDTSLVYPMNIEQLANLDLGTN